MISHPLSTDALLIHLLALHQAGVDPERSFLQSNAVGLEELWNRGLSCWQMSKSVAGNIRPRRMYEGNLTPKGLAAAEVLVRRQS